jgi:hypothetical protein
MMNEKKQPGVAKFRLETRNLRQSQNEKSAAPQTHPAEPHPRDAGGGFDPYNSSGGFDRRKNWERVGRR